MYLQKRNENYYFRFRLPKEINKYFLVDEIKKSLKTKEFKIAKSLATILYNNLQKFIWMVKYKMIGNSIIQTLAKDFKSFTKDKLVKELKALPDANKWIVQELDMYDDLITEYKSVKYLSDATVVKDDIENIKKQSNADIKLDDKSELQLAIQIAEARIDILKETKKDFQDGIYANSYIKPKNTTNYELNSIEENITVNQDAIKKEPISNHPINNIKSTTNSVVINQNSSNSIKDKFNEWLIHKEKNEKISKSSIKDYKAAYRYLILFFNENSDINTIRSKDLKNMQKTMLLFPKNILTAKRYKELNLNGIIEILENDILNNTVDEIAPLTNSRINGIFIHINTFFNYLVYEEYIDKNPVIVKPLPEEQSSKTAYTLDDLKLIFNTTLKLHQHIKDITLVALYSGMRIGEIIALEKENILDKNGILFFDIVKGKTENAPRTIPVHSKIKDIIIRLLKAKSSFLFNDGRYNATQKNVNYHLRKIIIDENKSFHSFRKNFTAKLYQNFAQYEQYIKVMIGHSTKANISYQTYAERQLDDKMKIEMMESIEFNLY